MFMTELMEMGYLMTIITQHIGWRFRVLQLAANVPQLGDRLRFRTTNFHLTTK
jgi:hypothetical protein